MLTPRFVKDIHDRQVREFEAAIARRDPLPESEQTRMVLRKVRHVHAASLGRSGQMACTCD